MPEETRPLEVTQRERDTIIAALRFWQHFWAKTKPDMTGLLAIAENDRVGRSAMLDTGEIDALIENRVNA